MPNDSDYKFHWADYVVFAASLLIALSVGVVIFITGRKNKTTDEYLLGGRNMNTVLVGISMVASGINAIYFLGGVAEVHYR